jgi:hypothetical protein
MPRRAGVIASANRHTKHTGFSVTNKIKQENEIKPNESTKKEKQIPPFHSRLYDPEAPFGETEKAF